MNFYYHAILREETLQIKIEERFREMECILGIGEAENGFLKK